MDRKEQEDFLIESISSNTEQKLIETCLKFHSLEQQTNEIYGDVKKINDKFGRFIKEAMSIIGELKSSFSNLNEVDKDIMLSVPMPPGIMGELG